MLRVSQVKLSPNHTEEMLIQKVADILRVHKDDIQSLEICKQSIDARKKPDIQYVYSVDVKLTDEKKVLKRQKGSQVSSIEKKPYIFPQKAQTPVGIRPVIIGSGPAGLFCAYMLALNGYEPILYERGKMVDDRIKDVEDFWRTGILNTSSNVQFGEGGAGTFSDGKLNTLIKDKDGRNRKVLEIFVENGAPKDILYVNKPHIGTDILIKVVQNMRRRIIEAGGEMHFQSQLIDFKLKDGTLNEIYIQTPSEIKKIDAKILILAIGHSARDTFSMLYKNNLPMSAKSFAVGVRVEHPQIMIDHAQYGVECPYDLPAAAYKLATTTENGRGVYSFCMCPGGYVVNASSEDKRLAINGMSYRARDGKNANSAIIVTVSKEDFENDHPLAGMEFQRRLEEKAYEEGNGSIPLQKFSDFCANQKTLDLGTITPEIKGAYHLANVRAVFPEAISISIEEGIKSFDKQIQGFANRDTLLSAVESRTSSPVRIHRNEKCEVEDTGIFPCGEGAGYAGGITSAAADGIKTAEMVAEKCRYFFTKK